MALINLDGISFGYPNGNQVLKGLSLRLEEGDKIGLLGENGTGKTTLFHIILGLLKPSKGEINIFGKKRETEQDFKKIRGAIGLLFQDSDDQLFCPTVIEDVAFGPLNMGMNHHEATDRSEQTLDELGDIPSQKQGSISTLRRGKTACLNGDHIVHEAEDPFVG